MIRVAGKTYNATIVYLQAGEDGADIEVVVFDRLGDEDVLAIKNAETIEEVAVNYGIPGEVVAEYNIVGWRSVGRAMNGIRFRFQTYRTTDINQVRQDNEDLTQAVLELAAMIGGTE